MCFALRAGYGQRRLFERIGGVLSAAKVDEGMGVRQGEVDSSDAFALFIDDLDDELRRASEAAGRPLGIPLVGNRDDALGDRISALKHVDDTVILATTAEDTQLMLDAVTRWCRKWQISPNPKKCEVIIFNHKTYGKPKFKVARKCS